MCTHGKYAHNKYIHKSIYVPCGKCRECQQSKANQRAVKIRNHNQDAHSLCLFVTLTYSNKYVPYIESSLLSNLKYFQCQRKVTKIPVYRDNDICYRFGKENKVTERQVVATFNSSDFLPDCHFIPWLKHKPNCTGVILWSDVQKFIKRLRINLFRNLNYNEKISYYAVGEYGSHSNRCHFHLLLYLPKTSLEKVRTFIVASWPYGDMLRSRKRIQIALDASSYLASYVSKSANLPKILESPVIRQKSSHSLHFGGNLSVFSLDSLLQKAYTQNMSYSREILKDGKPLLVTLPIPKYIINRYFPQFKGYSSFTADEVQCLLRLPQNYWYRLGYNYADVIIQQNVLSAGGLAYNRNFVISNRHTSLIAPENAITFDDYYKFWIRLKHAFDYYHKVTGKNIIDFSIDYTRVWLSRSMYILRHQYDDVSDFCDFYENAADFVRYGHRFSLNLNTNNLYETNPNNRSFLKHNRLLLLQQFIRKQNIKDMNNFALSSIDEEF